MSKVLDTVEPIKEVSTNDEKVQIINVLIEEYLNESIFPLENFNFSREQNSCIESQQRFIIYNICIRAT